MGEVSLRHQVVSLNDLVNVSTVNTNSDTHDHVLRSLDDFAIDSEKVRSFKSFETEIVVSEITIVDNGRVENVLVVHDDLVDVGGNHRSVFARLGVDPVIEI